MFLSNLEILRRCKEGLGVGLQAKYRHIRHPNRDWATRVRKYYYDDCEKYESLEKNHEWMFAKAWDKIIQRQW